MAVTLRFMRIGAKKQPFYRLVATDSRNPRDGRFIEIIGEYYPISKPPRLQVEEEKVYNWLRNGASTSQTVDSLFKHIGLWKKWNLLKSGQPATDVQINTEIRQTSRKKSKQQKESKPQENQAAPAQANAKAAKEPAGEAKKSAPPEEKKSAPDQAAESKE